MRALALLLAAAACGDSRIVLELAGEVPAGTRVDVVLLDPTVVAKKQLHNRTDPSNTDRTETVFYMAERGRATRSIEVEAGLQVEVEGAGAPYVPLVVVMDGERVLAAGVHDPASIFGVPPGEHRVPPVVAVSDVTIYPIELETIAKVFPYRGPGPQGVNPREVMTVTCGAADAVSGLAWRRADQHQLRVMAAPPPGKDIDRLQPPDLDCDQHSPGLAGLTRHVTGDELDCDDTAFTIHGAGREQCSRNIDEDCNPATTLSSVPCATLQCPYPRCVCDDAGESESCIEPVYGQQLCKLPMAGGKPCDGAGPLPLGLHCPGGCQVQIGWAPEGLEVTLSDNPGEMGLPLGVWVPVPDSKAFLTLRAIATRPFPPVLDIVLRIRTGIGVTDHVVPVALFEAACEAPSLLECPG